MMHNQQNKSKRLIVQKYGGATLADPQKIKQVARRIAETVQDGTQLIAVVSAMGKTTNSLIELAQQVSSFPQLRELDMLLSVGERMSMSLVSMALNDLGCPAISFTGSQAGILTDDAHINAFIKDVRPSRVQEALDQNKVVILAGFQGVSPTSKEITTLGRGGSDTSAVAMAAQFSAQRCEILKDVASVLTADPRVVPSARPLNQLNYDQMMEMTFWGAKVLHYRSVELAKMRDVTLYIGPAANQNNEGTLVKKGLNMFETSQLLSLNSHEKVLKIKFTQKQTHQNIETFKKWLEQKQLSNPQILAVQPSSDGSEIILTGPDELITALQKCASEQKPFHIDARVYSTVTMTCTGVSSPEILQKLANTIENENIEINQVLMSAMSISFLIDFSAREKALQKLHSLI